MPRANRPNRRRLSGAVMAMLALLPATTPLADEAGLPGTDPLQLVMFERDGCSYCRRWHDEIGPAYPKTAEGAAAPLRRIDLSDPLPDDVALTGRQPVFTPTFVLVRNGAEVGRIEGYAGDEFFWVLLDGMLDRAGWAGAAAGP